MRLAVTKGWKKFGKIMLCRSAPILVDAGYKTQLDQMLHRARLPENPQDIDSNDSVPIASTPMPEQPEVDAAAFPSEVIGAAFRSFSAFDDYLSGPSQVYLVRIF